MRLHDMKSDRKYIDLHLHLDGAISPASARDLAALQGISIPESDAELEKLIRVSPDCRDLNEFLEKFDFPCSLLQTEAGIIRAVANLLNELKAQRVEYAEIRFAPQKSTDILSQEQAVLAAIAGINEVSGIEAKLILCLMRGDDNHAENLETVMVAEKYLGRGVCAIDLAGAEGLFPTESFRNLFVLAGEKGIPFTIHAGEAAGPESIRAALDMGAKRIGHGVAAVKDENLLKRLAEEQIPLELCPSSNLNTAIFKNLSEFPLRKLMDSGVIVTINTDDPAIEGTDIRREYELLIEQFNLTEREVDKLIDNANKSRFK